MREILFRGKTLSNKQWVEGSLLKDEKGLCYIGTYLKIEDKTGFKLMAREQGKTHNRFVGMGFVQVDPETISQFTGLTDKNGVKIFEGDIVKGRHWTSSNNKSPEEYHIWRVKWSEKSGLITFVDSPTTAIKMSIHDFRDFGEAEVVGNIFDNPELMEGGGSDE